jgi:integrase
MARKGDGVEIRDRSIRLSFTLDGAPQRQTLMLNGAPMPPTPANIRYAHRLAGEIRDRIRHGTFSMAEYFPSAGGTTAFSVKQWLDTWLAALRIEASTRAGYGAALRFWDAVACDKHQAKPMGPTPLRALKPSHILTAMANRADLSGKTINNYLSVLRTALDLAVKDKVIFENPAADIAPAKHQKAPPAPFSRVESDAILAEVARAHPEQIYNLTEFWFWTGLRTSEILGLEWGNVDLASNTVLVASAYVRRQQKDKTKTAVARTVHLNSRALAALQRQRARTQMAGGRVFQDPRYGEPWADEDAFRRTYLGPDAQTPRHPPSPPVQHAPQLRDGDAHGRHDPRVLRETARAQRRAVPDDVLEVDRRRAERAGDGAARIGAFFPESSP